MSFHLSPSPLIQFSLNGEPAAGYQLCTFAAGTTTPIATYIDNSGNNLNTNPIVLDENGCAVVWLEDGVAYKFYLTTPTDTFPPSATAIYEVDNIESPSGSEQAFVVNIITTSTTLTSTNTNSLYVCNASAGTITVTLPASSEGLQFSFIKSDSTSNVVTIVPTSGTINGHSSVNISVQYHQYTLACDGTNWWEMVSPIAPTSATYITQTPNTNLYNSQALSNLSSGVLSVTTTTGVVSSIVPGNNQVMVTSNSGVVSFSSTLPSAVQSNITSTGTIATGTWHGSIIATSYGGTGTATLTNYMPVVGGIGTGQALQSVAAGTTVGQVLTYQGSSSVPTWTTVKTIPDYVSYTYFGGF